MLSHILKYFILYWIKYKIFHYCIFDIYFLFVICSRLINLLKYNNIKNRGNNVKIMIIYTASWANSFNIFLFTVMYSAMLIYLAFGGLLSLGFKIVSWFNFNISQYGWGGIQFSAWLMIQYFILNAFLEIYWKREVARVVERVVTFYNSKSPKI